jgi:AraC-like DNA-binding protein
MSHLPGNVILNAMNETILPNLARGVGRCVPLHNAANRSISKFTEVFPYGFHSHLIYEWLWILENEAHINIEGTVHHLRTGDFCLIPPHVRHAELYTQVTQPYRSLWSSYNNGTIYCTLCSFAPIGQLHYLASNTTQTTPLVPTLTAALEAELRNEQTYTTPMRHSLVSALAHAQARSLTDAPLPNEADDAPGSVSRRVQHYLNQHYHQDISLNDIAHSLHLSRAKLTATFKRETGKTIGEALTKMRIERARYYLIENELSIHEIARAVGYSSPEHFSRIFRRHEKMPPSRFGK